jgi:pSer/pThr/pTyr-binding forkhead associated (FHA) protein
MKIKIIKDKLEDKFEKFRSWVDGDEEPNKTKIPEFTEFDDEATIRPAIDDEATLKSFGTVEVWNPKGIKNTIQVLNQTVRIGRKSKKDCADIPLDADGTMSRNYAQLRFEGNIVYLKPNEPTILDKTNLKIGEEVQVFPIQLIKIGGYSLKAKGYASDEIETLKKEQTAIVFTDDEPTTKLLLYFVEVWQNDLKQKIPICDDKITVGRGKEAQIKLLGNTNISRKQIELIYENGVVFLIAHGKNLTKVDGKLVENKTKIQLLQSQEISIEDFTLRINFSSKL